MFVPFVRLLIVAAALSTAGVFSFGADRVADGAVIYRKHCVKCHGRNGEGVKGKYDDALHGDWSIQKLTRVIDRTMPEDAPEKVKGAEAEAVARYVHDAFYSREARARKNPPRVELVRLTNRQHANTVADLLKQFTGTDAPVGPERGLRAAYYDSKDFNRGKKVHDRVDRQVNFDFGEGSFDKDLASTNGFSIQWRGSLIADETGDYEFIVTTPNGTRLWVNDTEDALIDAWVASGEVTEHKATIRLLGGRVYPLRLHFFKFKDKNASISLQWKPPHGAREPIPARNLATGEVSPTFVMTTPFPPDDSSVGYERGVSVSKAWDEATTQAAIQVANYTVRHLDRLSQTKPADTNRAAKVEAFCSEFVTRAFRRPLTPEQKRIFVTSHVKAAGKIEDAVKRVVLLALKSPRFLYLGLDAQTPDDFEVAARLSFGLWDSLPDSRLWELAASGALHAREQIVEQSRRMLQDPRARAKMQYFLHQWLQVNHAEDLAKDAVLYPGFTPEIIADLRTSLNLFIDDVVWNGASDFRELLLADDLYVNDRLAKFYGIASDASDDFVKVELGEPRSGVLTHPYLLAAFSYPKSTSPIHRGVFLTRNVVGRALKPPPVAVAFKDSEFAPNLSMREKVAELTSAQACQTCHSVINPLGFSLEHYDAVGRFRTEDNAKPINAVSEYVTDDGTSIRLSGARDVAQFAIGSEQAQNGFIEQLFHQVVKQPLLAYGPKVMDSLRESFVASGFNLQKLLVDIATISALHGIPQNLASANP